MNNDYDVTQKQFSIPFDAGEKLRWLEAIIRDPLINKLDICVAVGITNRISKHIGSAPIAQLWLAKFIGASERGVRDAANHLVALGHLKIDRSEAVAACNRKTFGGRGKANVYYPVLPPKPHKETQHHSAGFERAETRQRAAPNPEIASTKPGATVPPLPKDSQKTSLGGSADNPVEVDDPGNLRWPAVKKRLADRLGPAVMVSWFNNLTLKQMTEHEAVLVASSQFICRHIENNYLGDRLLEAWKAEQPTITRVLLIPEDNANNR